MHSVEELSHAPPPSKKAERVQTVEPNSAESGAPEVGSTLWWLEKLVKLMSIGHLSSSFLLIYAEMAQAKHIEEIGRCRRSNGQQQIQKEHEEVRAGKLKFQEGEAKLREGLTGMQKETQDLEETRAAAHRELEDMGRRKLELEEWQAMLEAREAKVLGDETKIRGTLATLQVDQVALQGREVQVRQGVEKNKRDVVGLQRREGDLQRGKVDLNTERKEVRKAMAKAQKINAEALETLVASRISERAVNEAGEQRRKWEDKTKQRLRNSGAKGFPQ